MPPPDVDISERKLIEAKGFKNFLEPPDETGLMWIKSKKDESCFFLTEANKCSIYSIRPAVCKLQPYTVADYDYEAEIVELELNFPFSECCEGVTEGKLAASEQEEVEKAAVVLVRRILGLTAADMELPVTDRRVHAETRSRLLRRTVELADLRL
jgi:Fe-S-cluster containining protein